MFQYMHISKLYIYISIDLHYYNCFIGQPGLIQYVEILTVSIYNLTKAILLPLR